MTWSEQAYCSCWPFPTTHVSAVLRPWPCVCWCTTAVPALKVGISHKASQLLLKCVAACPTLLVLTSQTAELCQVPSLLSDTFVCWVLCVPLVCLLSAPYETINHRQKAHICIHRFFCLWSLKSQREDFSENIEKSSWGSPCSPALIASFSSKHLSFFHLAVQVNLLCCIIFYLEWTLT